MKAKSKFVSQKHKTEAKYLYHWGYQMCVLYRIQSLTTNEIHEDIPTKFYKIQQIFFVFPDNLSPKYKNVSRTAINPYYSNIIIILLAHEGMFR